MGQSLTAMMFYGQVYPSRWHDPAPFEVPLEATADAVERRMYRAFAVSAEVVAETAQSFPRIDLQRYDEIQWFAAADDPEHDTALPPPCVKCGMYLAEHRQHEGDEDGLISLDACDKYRDKEDSDELA